MQHVCVFFEGKPQASAHVAPLSAGAAHRLRRCPRSSLFGAPIKQPSLTPLRTPACCRLEREVRRDVAAGRLPSVQPFHAMAYPFPADLALTIGTQYAQVCARHGAVAYTAAGGHQPGRAACYPAPSPTSLLKALARVSAFCPDPAPHRPPLQYCLSVAQRLGLPRLPHPPSVPLAPGQRLRVGYVSSDFGNHPLSHLMGAVFGMHDRRWAPRHRRTGSTQPLAGCCPQCRRQCPLSLLPRVLLPRACLAPPPHAHPAPHHHQPPPPPHPFSRAPSDGAARWRCSAMH